MDSPIIMLVEDNPDDEALTLRAFKKCLMISDVVVAHDGIEALDYLFGDGAHSGRDTRGMPRLVLLDLKLPKVDGLEVLRRLRADQRTKLLPIVILTSSRDRNDVANCYYAGANSYIRKPLDFAEFSELVQQLGLYWLVLNESPVGAGAAE